MKLYSRKISRGSVPRGQYRIMIRNAQQELLLPALSLSFPSVSREEALVTARGPHGKPFLPGYPSFHYNFTDSGDWLILAVSGNESEIGVDLQKIVPVKAGCLNMAERFFHPDDVRRLKEVLAGREKAFPPLPFPAAFPAGEALPAERMELLFFRMWTVKEAYLKYTGEGLSGGMNRYSVDFESRTIGGVPFTELKPPGTGYLLSVCCS